MSLQLITISGEPGCGKTTVARQVAHILQAEYYSTGHLLRQLANELGISILQLNQQAELDQTIDQKIDQKTLELGLNLQKNTVVDARLGWHFLPKAFKVYLTCPSKIAAQRVFQRNTSTESYADLATAEQGLMQRQASENARFYKFYRVHLSQLRNYDLVIDTSFADPQSIADKIIAYSCQNLVTPTVLLNPQSILVPYLPSVADYPKTKNQLARVESFWCMFTLPEDLEVALSNADDFYAATFLGMDTEVFGLHQTIKTIAQKLITVAGVKAWEKKYHFSYIQYPSWL
ncbi:MAG: cytidylate kinase family protein [Gammaproteobacteria bacterium]|nr:cytidylate kinase family protein [Gammaproteobacteria bacterium]